MSRLLIRYKDLFRDIKKNFYDLNILDFIKGKEVYVLIDKKNKNFEVLKELGDDYSFTFINSLSEITTYSLIISSFDFSLVNLANEVFIFGNIFLISLFFIKYPFKKKTINSYGFGGFFENFIQIEFLPIITVSFYFLLKNPSVSNFYNFSFILLPYALSVLNKKIFHLYYFNFDYENILNKDYLPIGSEELILGNELKPFTIAFCMFLGLLSIVYMFTVGIKITFLSLIISLISLFANYLQTFFSFVLSLSTTILVYYLLK